MDPQLTKRILDSTNSTTIERVEVIQSLWSGYGELKRYFLAGGKHATVIVKHIQMPETAHHPRGWNTELSHQRKLKSYQVEAHWYQAYATKTTQACKVPAIYHVLQQESELLLIMEDLDAHGFALRHQPESVTLEVAKNCLSWLANFHATFMGHTAEGLWSVGTYWHLATRPDEWKQMKNADLKKAASAIDGQLNTGNFKTLVHGDAKLANFCFSEDGKVAAVDFQYVGQGCGMKDVAYLISSCFTEEASEKYEEELLAHYFNELQIALDNTFDFQLVKEEWERLYPYAWADFYRFLDGWSPGHWKMHGYSKRLTKKVFDELDI